MHTNFPGHYNFNMWETTPTSLILSPPGNETSRSQLLRQLSTTSLRTFPRSYFRCDFLISFPVDQQYSGGKSISHDSKILCHSLVGFFCADSSLSITPATKVWVNCIWDFCELNPCVLFPHAHTPTCTWHAPPQWSEVQDYLMHPSDKPVVLNRSSSTNSINPFGSTYCYGHQNVIFEVSRN